MSYRNNIISILAVSLAIAYPTNVQGSGGHEGHKHEARHEHHENHTNGKRQVEIKDLQPRIPDPTLVDQHGKSHRFYTDLVKGKLVLMNSIYTTCPGTCPTQTAIFARVQRMLEEREGPDVQIISVSLDPVTDTPKRLKEFSERFKVSDGWVFLTGDKQAVTDVLQAMDLYSPVPAEHTPIAAIGHEPGAVWMKTINLTSPVDIVGKLDHVNSLGERSISRN